MAIKKISIVGSGNVAEALGGFLQKADLDIVEIYSRNEDAGSKLAEKLNADFQKDINGLKYHAGLFILAVPDDVIKKIAGDLPEKIRAKSKIVHCSGSTPSTVLSSSCQQYGVFYPLQTFTKGRKISARKIPFCICASSDRLEKSLLQLGKQLSNSVHFISDAERCQLHLAAVIINNFTNHLLTVAADYIEKNGLSFDLLSPLIEETVKKAVASGPRKVQTGPAKRGDQKTIERHLKMLKKDAKMADLYRQFSINISEYYNK